MGWILGGTVNSSYDIMGFVGRMCILITALILPWWINNQNTYYNTAWSKAEPKGTCVPATNPVSCKTKWCNASDFPSGSTERQTIIAMVAVGFSFTFLFMLFTPCLLIEKMSRKTAL